MGRKPKPTMLKLIQGNPGKRAISKNEPKPAQTQRVPAPPSHLTTKAKSEWKRIAKELHATGILTRVDTKALAAYCQAFDDMVTAQGLLAKWNMDNRDQINTQRTVSGTFQTHPYVIQIRDARRDMVRFAAEFGITPSARSRVVTAGKKKDNEFEGF